MEFPVVHQFLQCSLFARTRQNSCRLELRKITFFLYCSFFFYIDFVKKKMKWSANNWKDVPTLETPVVNRSFQDLHSELTSAPICKLKNENDLNGKRKFDDDSCDVNSETFFNRHQQDVAKRMEPAVECTNTDRLFRQQRKQRKKLRMLLHNSDDRQNRQQQLLGDFPGLCSNKPQKLNQTTREVFSLQVQQAMIADEDGDRAIHIAVAQENVPLVKKLCSLMRKVGASLDTTNMLRQTPLHIAIIVGNCQIASILLSYGASLHVKDRHGNNAVQLAVKFFQIDTFSFIVAKCKSTSHLDAVDYDGLTALHHAVFQRNCAAVDGLCQAGADVNAVDGKSGKTPLVHAVLSGYMDMVNLLLKYKACPDKSDYAGWSAVELAVQTGNRTMMRLFEINGSIKQESDCGCANKMSWDDSQMSVDDDDGPELTGNYSKKKKKSDD